MGSTTEDSIPTYPPSLPVPNVQEMVWKDPLKVPERYIRNEEEMHTKPELSHLSSQVPVIDLSLLSNGNKEELLKLDLACKEWGFFQVVNHGVESKVLQGLKDASAEFFELPLEEKNKISMPPNDIQGYGHAYVVSEDQILDWSDALIMLVYPSWFRNVNIWPTKPETLKDSMEAYSTELKRVAKELLGSLSLIMGMEKGYLLELHKELVQAMRVNYYPPCPTPENVLGISPHSDTSTITILMQDGDVTGLQIRHQGGWVPVRAIPKALVVNVGDVTEILSNGKYKSIEHRAVTNESKSRLSYATFFIPLDEVEIGPLSHLIDTQGSLPLYKKIKYGDYVRNSMKMKHDGKAHTQIAKAK
ncbi:oxoglutarate-dependent flavonoid 7-O-demethylase 1-like [Humulus lupulus]|uniref:oxoglutarate-dependent flavonoid 7-O-demethylase 1-like n=1 Tax=Humulus lupulus TaxID=3486 RepID=UPI002B40E60C|nr:oxoglutarate-dependent flavonoid 7-O-demethylase 1-like [Humulus lupulus]